MEDIDIEAGDTGEQRDSRGRLTKGHAKLPGSGRKPGVGDWNARCVAESMQCSPLIAALTVIKTWHWPLAPGEKPGDRKRCSPELWTRILLETVNARREIPLSERACEVLDRRTAVNRRGCSPLPLPAGTWSNRP